MDGHYDLVRVVRDKQFKYIRNYQPDKINYQDIAYRKQMDLMQEILRLKEAGKLDSVQGRWFAAKPVEELYNIQQDPNELHNLAGNPAYQEDLERMRQAQNDWVIAIRDKGFMDEYEMVEMMWPEGKQPVTAQPETNITAHSKKTNTVKITCDTEGASIGYKLGDDGHWMLYSEQIEVPKDTKLFAKSIRYGFKPSEEVVFSEAQKVGN